MIRDVPGATQTDFWGLIGSEPDERSEPSATAKPTEPNAKLTRPRRLQQHELGAVIPKRTADERRRLLDATVAHRAAGAGRRPTVDIVTLEGKVLWDWERYKAAYDAGLNINLVGCPGHDPVSYLCVQALHQQVFDAGTKALIVLKLCDPAGRGRPKKSTHRVDLWPSPRTEAEMAKMSGVGTTMISRAKDLIRYGVADRVLAREVKFTEMYRRLQAVKSANLAEGVLDGAMTFDEAYAIALTDTVDPSQKPTSKKEWMDQIATLESVVVNSKEDNLELMRHQDALTNQCRYYKDQWEAAARERDELAEKVQVYEERIRWLKKALHDAGVAGVIDLSERGATDVEC